MLFRDFTYTPCPAQINVRILCAIIKSPSQTINEAYQIHPQHRNGNPNKSRWTVSYEDELSIFAGTAIDGVITDGQYMWGLFVPLYEPEVLGVTKNGDQSRIAIFDNGKHNGFWHGYPADYIREQEIPPDDVLDLWRTKEIIRKPDINKIIKGQW